MMISVLETKDKEAWVQRSTRQKAGVYLLATFLVTWAFTVYFGEQYFQNILYLNMDKSSDAS